MSQPSQVREAAKTALQQVTGLRCHSTVPGTVAPPAAIIEHGQIGPFPATFDDSAEYVLRITILVQHGDFRAAQLKVEDLIDPVGTVSSSAVAALQSDPRFGQVTITEFGTIPFTDDAYAGAVLAVQVFV